MGLALAGLTLLAGCQALSGEGVATLDADLTAYASESQLIRAVATQEQIMVIETLIAAGTRVAELSAVNAALGATLRANYTGTPEVRAVVVSAEDMGSSLESDRMDESITTPAAATMRVSNLSTAESVDPASGCSNGTISQFTPDGERIYVTARVTELQAGSYFEVDWQFDERRIYQVSWLADYAKSVECIWFFATPVDFAFLPGSYSATLYVDGEAIGTTDFSVVAS
ncbi:MAG: hypothetical protein OXG85_03895 [Chloroflexi bacterium]|nr:hypothetical protein [Chloroflexota bacterium]